MPAATHSTQTLRTWEEILSRYPLDTSLSICYTKGDEGEDHGYLSTNLYE